MEVDDEDSYYCKQFDPRQKFKGMDWWGQCNEGPRQQGARRRRVRWWTSWQWIHISGGQHSGAVVVALEADIDIVSTAALEKAHREALGHDQKEWMREDDIA